MLSKRQPVILAALVHARGADALHANTRSSLAIVRVSIVDMGRGRRSTFSQ